MNTNYLESARKQFDYYKSLGDKTFAQLNDEQMLWQYNAESNSIATIVQHMAGNMLSRWTDFMTTDGEKEWRNRDAEFGTPHSTKEAIIECWQKGWQCLFAALDSLQAEDLAKTIYIRNEGHSVLEAVNRQLAHYPYHVGQIVFLGKMLCDDAWTSLSIPKGNSQQYNEAQFGKGKH
jgi:hypothetical protein